MRVFPTDQRLLVHCNIHTLCCIGIRTSPLKTKFCGNPVLHQREDLVVINIVKSNEVAIIERLSDNLNSDLIDRFVLLQPCLCKERIAVIVNIVCIRPDLCILNLVSLRVIDCQNKPWRILKVLKLTEPSSVFKHKILNLNRGFL